MCMAEELTSFPVGLAVVGLDDGDEEDGVPAGPAHNRRLQRKRTSLRML